MIARWTDSRKDRAGQALFLGALLLAPVTGMVLARGGPFSVLLAFGLVTGLIIANRPAAGLYACYPLLLLVPYNSLRLDVPIFQSPLQLVAGTTLGIAIARQLVEGRPFPKSRLYLPLSICLMVLGTYAIAGHGQVASERFSRFATDLWPLVLIPMLVRTPRQARNVLLALVGSAVALALLWLPGLLALARSPNPSIVRDIAAGAVAEPSIDLALLGTTGSLSYLTLVAMALVAPVLLSVAMADRRWRVPSAAGFGVLALGILASTYAAAVAALAVGTLVTVTLLLVSPIRAERRRTRRILALLPLVGPVALLGLALPPAQAAIQRLLHPAADLSASERLFALTQGVGAFLTRPLTGYGAFDVAVVTPEGWLLGGHSSFIVMAYEFGLFLLIPFAWALVRLGREYASLLRRAQAPVEKGLTVGLAASFASALVTAFVTPVFGDVVQDAVIWTFAGLAIVWISWKQRNPQAALVA